MKKPMVDTTVFFSECFVLLLAFFSVAILVATTFFPTTITLYTGRVISDPVLTYRDFKIVLLFTFVFTLIATGWYVLYNVETKKWL